MRNYIEAKEGFVLTDGEVFGKRIYLADGESAAAYKEIPETDYKQIMAQAALEK